MAALDEALLVRGVVPTATRQTSMTSVVAMRVLMGLCMVITVMSISSISMVAMGSRRVIMGSTTCGRVISRVLVRVLRGCAVIAVIAVITSRVMAALMTSITVLCSIGVRSMLFVMVIFWVAKPHVLDLPQVLSKWHSICYLVL